VEALLIQISVGASLLSAEYPFSKGVKRGEKGILTLPRLVVVQGEHRGGHKDGRNA
jgi:hypothetical protein